MGRISVIGATLQTVARKEEMGTKRSSETSILTRATWCHILEDGIHRSHRRENL
jgi:hypothetical protein